MTIPKWMQRLYRWRVPVVLPAWAQIMPGAGKMSVCIGADTDGYVREWLGLLGITEPNQYWLEVAYQCAKLDLQAALVGTKYDIQIANKMAGFYFSRAPQWAQRNFPAGRGIEAATQGTEAREHYKRIRGRLPL